MSTQSTMSAARLHLPEWPRCSKKEDRIFQALQCSSLSLLSLISAVGNETLASDRAGDNDGDADGRSDNGGRCRSGSLQDMIRINECRIDENRARRIDE